MIQRRLSPSFDPGYPELQFTGKCGELIPDTSNHQVPADTSPATSRPCDCDTGDLYAAGGADSAQHEPMPGQGANRSEALAAQDASAAQRTDRTQTPAEARSHSPSPEPRERINDKLWG